MLSSFKGKSPDKHQDTPVNATDILTGTQRPVVEPAAAKVEPATKTDTDAQSCIGPGMSIVGKIECSGPAQIFGRIEGELQASDLLIGNGAQVEGTVVAQDLTIRVASRARSAPSASGCKAAVPSKGTFFIARCRSTRAPCSKVRRGGWKTQPT
jgi:hypothetical protein